MSKQTWFIVFVQVTKPATFLAYLIDTYPSIVASSLATKTVIRRYALQVQNFVVERP